MDTVAYTSDCQIICGVRVMIDLCLGDSQNILQTLSTDSVDLTVTSPPYDNLRDYNGNGDSWNKETFQNIADELFRITNPGGGCRVDSR